MLTFFQNFSELVAVLSEKKDGSMKVFPEQPEGNSVHREKFFQKQGIDTKRVISAAIVHGTQAVVVSDPSRSIILGADALVTREKNLFLSVTVADCFPVFLYDPIARVIGIAHAGWRGIEGGMIEKTIEAFLGSGAHREDISVSIGPGIQKCHFEIGKDILPRFAGFEKYIIHRNKKIFLDLPGIAQEQLRNAGIGEQHIEVSPLCTFSESERFFSYRRDKPKKMAAQVALIGRKPF